jgi:hypothetical protein
VSASGEEKQSDDWKLKKTKMSASKIGVPTTVNVSKNMSSKTACP